MEQVDPTQDSHNCRYETKSKIIYTTYLGLVIWFLSTILVVIKISGFIFEQNDCYWISPNEKVSLKWSFEKNKSLVSWRSVYIIVNGFVYFTSWHEAFGYQPLT